MHFKARAKDTLPFIHTVLFGHVHYTRWTSRAHMVYELTGTASRPVLWMLWPAAVLLCLSSKFSYSLVQGQRPGPTKLSGKRQL